MICKNCKRIVGTEERFCPMCGMEMPMPEPLAQEPKVEINVVEQEVTPNEFVAEQHEDEGNRDDAADVNEKKEHVPVNSDTGKSKLNKICVRLCTADLISIAAWYMVTFVFFDVYSVAFAVLNLIVLMCIVMLGIATMTLSCIGIARDRARDASPAANVSCAFLGAIALVFCVLTCVINFVF